MSRKRKKYTVRTMTPEELRRMQLIQVELLGELDRICTKYHITYVVWAGAQLGAVRHGGFIPWDDDIDIGMVRSEYRKFCKACAKELNREKYFFQTHDTDPEYRWGHAKILKNGTSFVRYGQEHMKMKRGVYIEIFPMDGVPENPVERKIFNALRICGRKIMWSEVGKVSCESAVMRLWFGLLNRIPVEKVFAMFEFLARRYNEKRSRYVTCLYFEDYWIKGYRGFKREYFVKTKRMAFEGIEMNIPRKNKEFLVVQFGQDYMTPPPVEERGTHIPASSFEF